MYIPTRIGVSSLADVVVALPEDGQVARNDVYGVGAVLPLVAPGEALTLETTSPATASVRVLELSPARPLERGVPRTVRLEPDPDRGHFADLTFTLDRVSVIEFRWSAEHESREHRGTHHPELSVYGANGPVHAFQHTNADGTGRVARGWHLPPGDYRVRLEADDDEWLSFCSFEPAPQGCEAPPDASRDYAVHVQWDFTDKPSWMDSQLPEPSPHAPPTVALAHGEHAVEVEPRPDHAHLRVDVPDGHDLFFATASPVALFYETRIGGEMRSSGICRDNRCVLPRVRAEEVFIEADNVTTPTVVPLTVQVLPPPDPTLELRVDEVALLELGETEDPRGPMAAVALVFAETGTFLLTAKVPYGPIEPYADLVFFSPFGDDGAHDTFGNLFVEREVDGTKLMTTPDYAGMFIEVEEPGKHLVRIDGTGRAPARTIELELVRYR